MAAIAEYHRLGALNTKNLFLSVSKAGKFKSKASAGLPSVKALSFRLQTTSPCCHMVAGARSSKGSPIRAFISFMRAPFQN